MKVKTIIMMIVLGIIQQSCIMLDVGLSMVDEEGNALHGIYDSLIHKTDTSAVYLTTQAGTCRIDSLRNFRYSIDVAGCPPDIKINSFYITRKKEKDTLPIRMITVDYSLTLRNKSDTIGIVMEKFKRRGYRRFGRYLDKEDTIYSLPAVIKSDYERKIIRGGRIKIHFCTGFGYVEHRRFYIHCDVEIGDFYRLRRTFKYRRVLWFDFRPKIW